MTAAADTLPEPPVRALWWEGDAATGALSLLDQTLLPQREVVLVRGTAAEIVQDLKRLAIRGAPALGVAAAYGLVLAARTAGADRSVFLREAGALRDARPTAVNLRRAVDRSLAAITGIEDPAQMARRLLEEARALEAFERRACEAIGRYGAERLRGRPRILTHCNAGALVTPGLGTALAPIYVLHHRGEPVHVWVDETRPLLQGLRLTAYELSKAGVPHSVLVDGAAAGLIARGWVDAVIVGADRICANGDVVNKVGTYALALAAHRHGVPFLVAAPGTTLDPTTPSGADVEIEERPADLATYLQANALGPWEGSYAPAFDVTPVALVTALVTDQGIFEPPGNVTGKGAAPLPPSPAGSYGLQGRREDIR